MRYMPSFQRCQYVLQPLAVGLHHLRESRFERSPLSLPLRSKERI